MTGEEERRRALRTVDAAAFLGVSPSSLRRWAKSGEGPPSYRTPGGHRRYRVADLRAWQATQSTADAAEEDAPTLMATA